MGRRADELARRLEATTEAVVAAIEAGRRDEDAERRLAHHLATTHALMLSLAQSVINEEPLPSISWEMIHEINAQHVRANSTVGRAEAVELLRTVTVSAADTIRGFTDEQLKKSASWGLGAEDADVCALTLIEARMIRHAEEHLATGEERRSA